MWFVVVGVILLVLKLAALGPFAHWSWWVVIAPFAAALLWWALSDHLGWTTRAAQRREHERLERRRASRIESLGLRPTQPRMGDASLDPSGRSGAAGSPAPGQASGGTGSDLG